MLDWIESRSDGEQSSDKLDFNKSNFYRKQRARRDGSERTLFPPFDDISAPVEVENDVWIGNDVLLSHGVKLGTGSIIAARSVVTCDVPPYAIVAGVPARVIRYRFEEPVIDRLLHSNWWQWSLNSWDCVDPREISQFLDLVDTLVETTEPMTENRVTAANLIRNLQNLEQKH